ncbi:hypothetical protein KFK09_004215 [Dendrobium nobile]|uniref:Integrase zinc-binding domain-containing protein n=1 Tax=Dendrobium nobile TaxID=94219 RepID=A0A8T3C557_DENNO|nr:hypothetical protein KFK09_004215 [Dendrobium nobile]
MAGKRHELSLAYIGVIFYKDRLWVPSIGDLRAKILHEAHYLSYTIHPRSSKMYKDLKCMFRWSRLKKDIIKFVSKCDASQLVRADP